MGNTLLTKHGHVIIPKNTLLYRGNTSIEINECMFFALIPTIASAFGSDVQVWKVISNIQVIFLIDYIDHQSNSFSSIPLLYNYIFPEEENRSYNDLDIKQNLERRNKFVRNLNHKHKLFGWLSSVENNSHLEICLFNESFISNNTQLIELTNTQNEKYYIDTLKKIKIFPNEIFFSKSHQTIRMNSYYDCDDKTKWRKYRKYINYCIKSESKSERDIKWNKMYWSNLRTKFKI